MVWSPQFTVLDATTIADNLMAYILANQAAALTWANGTTLKELRPASEIWVENADPDAVRADAKKYLRALKTMMQDCPNATVIANTDAGVIEDRLRPIVEMPPMRSTENETHFFQSFQITAGFRLIAGAEY
jgi:hypothetical protein